MYAIAGATGRTGRAVAESLLARGESIRVIVRGAAHGKRWKSRGAGVAVADLRDPAALAAALRGVRGAYLLIPTDPTVPDLTADQTSFLAGIAAALDATHVPHVVLLSSVGAELATGTGPIAGLHAAEHALRGIPGTTATFLRSVYFMENVGGSLGMLEQSLLPTFLPEDLAIPMVATRDVGVAAARLLAEGPLGREVVYATGPRPYSQRDVARILTRLLAREVRVQRAPWETMVPALIRAGLSADVATAYREMTESLASGRISLPPDREHVLGPTDMETVLRDLLPALTASLPE